jgi:ribosomal protein S18 acetylase RimI-like enzyme
MTDLLRLLPLDQVSPVSIAGFVEACAVSRLLTEPPFVVEPRHRYYLELVEADAACDDAVSTAAMRGSTVVGLSVLRFPRWDREHFGFPVGRVDHLIAADSAAMDALTDGLVRDLHERAAVMCSARLSCDALPALQSLETRGFRFQEHTLTPWRSLSDWKPQGFGVTRPTETDDVPELCAIARRAFRSDRFHRDPHFDRPAADGVYEKWVRTWHGQPVPDRYSLVLVEDDQVVGFVMFDVLLLHGRVGRIVLNSIDPRHAGRGHGFRMYCDVLDFLRERADFATSVIATGNVAVVNLYAKLGFTFSSGGDVTLHRWT